MYVVDSNNVLVEKKVVVGITSDFDAEIVEGLEAGDLVVNLPSLSLKISLIFCILTFTNGSFSNDFKAIL